MELPALPDGVFKTALDHIAMVAITDLQGNILYVNNKFCMVSGYTATELVGQHTRLLSSGLHEKKIFRSNVGNHFSGPCVER